MATPAALFTGLVKAQMAPAIRQLRIEAAMKFFSRWPDVKRMALLRRVYGGQSKSQSVQNQQTYEHCRKRQAEHFCRCTLARHDVALAYPGFRNC
jgi:hypothetical protein